MLQKRTVMGRLIKNKQGYCILLLSILMFSSGLYFNLLHAGENFIVLIIEFLILMEVSKLIIEMVIRPNAPIKIRYVLAGMIIAASREFYIGFLEESYDKVGVAIIAIGLLLWFRAYAIKSTLEHR